MLDRALLEHLHAVGQVAILADPGGPVLESSSQSGAVSGSGLRSSPTPEGRCWRTPPWSCRWSRSCCDPRRPRRAGAGLLRVRLAVRIPHRVAILADPGGPVLADNYAGVIT